jgi:hypothetical protein
MNRFLAVMDIVDAEPSQASRMPIRTVKLSKHNFQPAGNSFAVVLV